MKQKALRVSIVIPTYNEADGICATLDSIASQTIPPYEVIIVDNNCSDNTVKLAEQYDFVTVIKEPVQGMITARNTGLRFASGDIVARIDGDSRLCPTWIEQVTTFFTNLDNNHFAGCTGPLYFCDIPFKRLGTIVHRIVYFGTAKIVYGRQVFFGSNMAFRQRDIPLILKYGKKDTDDVHEDIDTTLVLASQGRVVFLPHLVVGVSFIKTAGSPKKIIKHLRKLLSRSHYHPLIRF